MATVHTNEVTPIGASSGRQGERHFIFALTPLLGLFQLLHLLHSLFKEQEALIVAFPPLVSSDSMPLPQTASSVM